MPTRGTQRTIAAIWFSFAALAASGCVREISSSGPSGPTLSSTFVGYSDPAAQQVMCGNCHEEKQRSWIETGHAKAWAAVEASSMAGPTCERCHTTNGSSNIAPDSAGYLDASPAARAFFRDVQCEACHGPGAAHITLPDQTQPIPYLVSYDSALGVGCGTCHSGAPHASFYEDWSHGAHRLLEGPAISVGGTCLQCHEGKTVEQRFGGSDAFVEYADANVYPIGCATCHDPHGSANTAELREPITVRDTTNLCIRCHHRNANPDTANTRGPHSPQGPTFLATSGWQPPGFSYDTTIIPPHADVTANPDLCVTCHVDTLDVTNGAGQLAWHYTGHGFYAIPCVDTAGVDSTDSCGLDQRSFAACARSGCHSSTEARDLFVALDSEMTFLTGVLWTDDNGDGKVDSGDGGLLPQVPAAEFTRDSVITVAEGALFNVQLVGVDGSHGVHNPPYLRALLAATADAVRQQYGLALAPAVEARVARLEERRGRAVSRVRNPQRGRDP